jgi:hypothetical protein
LSREPVRWPFFSRHGDEMCAFLNQEMTRHVVYMQIGRTRE